MEIFLFWEKLKSDNSIIETKYKIIYNNCPHILYMPILIYFIGLKNNKILWPKKKKEKRSTIII